ncbi:MAG: hypothetical protein V4509_01030 [Patescibacteria group bacterium]
MNESKLFESQPDFFEIYHERLNNTEPFSSQKSEVAGSWYGYNNIRITKEMPAVLFNPDTDSDTPTAIWIIDPKKLSTSPTHSTHAHARLDLMDSTGLDVKEKSISAYLLEDSNKNLYLSLDQIRAKKIDDRREDVGLFDLLNKYGISEVTSQSATINSIKINPNNPEIETSIQAADFITRNSLEKRREGLALVEIAKAHKMNTSQYLRLVTLSKALFEAGQQVNLDSIAKSIVDEPDDTKIDVEHLHSQEEN